ncbi:MAG TPA: hypothetical protein VIY51_26685 [Xanthobacteraceae bacterium]
MLLFPALLPALTMGAHLTIAVADPVPSFNVEPSCRAAASGAAGIKQDMSVCLDDEKGARDQLAKEWGEFAANDRGLCTRLATTGGSPTYTELLVCLQMARDARKLPKEDTLVPRP